MVNIARRLSLRGSRRNRFAKPGAAFRFFGVFAVVLTVTFSGALRFRIDLPWIVSYLAAINVVTFVAYLFDKAASGRQWLRIPEPLLHLLAAAGGTPAAWIGQLLLRHKTIKRSFRIWFWTIFVMQILLIAGCFFYYEYSRRI